MLLEASHSYVALLPSRLRLSLLHDTKHAIINSAVNNIHTHTHTSTGSYYVPHFLSWNLLYKPGLA